ncbi:MAG TPA: signal peptidase I [Polyangiaceae bacterium]|nr:signal peptidase I [Polyangiaceae bacterium]
MTSQRLLRYAYLAGFFLLLPLFGAVLIVSLAAPDDTFTPSGPFETLLAFFRDQRVPVGILLFTVLEYALWANRHRLPGAELLATPGRASVPPDFHGEYERASALLDEAERLEQRHRRQLERRLGAAEREALEGALEGLRKAMAARPFEGPAFEKALAEAEAEIGAKLGPYRKGELREYTESIGVAVAIALLLRVFVIEAFKIPSGSMIPTLQIGDHIFVNKMAYGPLVPWTRLRLFPSMPPRRGDVMVFEFPERRDQDFIKRVIALPGDRLEVKDGHPILNGWAVPSCPVGSYTYHEGSSVMTRRAEMAVEYLDDKAYLTVYERTFSSNAGETQGPYFAKPGEVWVLGDNRNNSHDSRSWFGGKGGGVPFDNIKGRAMFVWLSVDQEGNWALSRIGTRVLGLPAPPPNLPQNLIDTIGKCVEKRPPLTATTPPAPPR